MRGRLLLTLGILLTLARAATAQTNPCTAANPGLVVNPTTLYITLVGFTEVEIDNQPRINDYEYALFAEGADPTTATPLQGPSTMPRSAFTLQSVTTDCYRADLPAAVPMPSGQRLIAGLRAHRTARSGITEARSAYVGSINPFGVAPSVIPAPGQARVVGGS